MKGLENIDVCELLLQKAPFIMVGKLLSCDENTTITETVIKSDSIFVDNGKLSSSGLIENIAQTCAVRMGYFSKYIYHIDVMPGYIGAIRNLRIFYLPNVNDALTTTITVRGEVFNMTLVDATVNSGDELIATGEMKIAIKR